MRCVYVRCCPLVTQSKRNIFSSCDRDPVILTLQLDLDNDKIKQQVKISSSKVSARTDTHRNDCFIRATKLVGISHFPYFLMLRLSTAYPFTRVIISSGRSGL